MQNEFRKHLQISGKEWLVELFNNLNCLNVLVFENILQQWCASTTVMIFKKGDPASPNNYRPISIFNHLLKMFTQIIQSSLIKWADVNGLIPECQAGFRKGRSIEEKIFCLNSAIQINKHSQKRKGKLYALFIDFAKAFNSIPHLFTIHHKVLPTTQKIAQYQYSSFTVTTQRLIQRFVSNES